ncbi:MAG: excalibur calcium-binding domain-containing protein [Stenomitos rutilans HA7619-LM2]|jgi:micrococcal nuclease|nr:excalibur calcium-binding domain-containing protein [Stenomitos rutilans HA7619-LM2]
MKWLLAFGLSLAIVCLQLVLSPPLHSAPSGCDAAYPGVCIPSLPPDLDCKDITFKNFRVLSPDPHRFDGDKDGIGCESKR